MNYNTECYNQCYSTFAWEEKASWKPVKDNRILALYREVITEARRKGFLHYCAETPPLRISSKLRRAIAFCYQHRVDCKSSRTCIVPTRCLTRAMISFAPLSYTNWHMQFAHLKKNTEGAGIMPHTRLANGGTIFRRSIATVKISGKP